MLVTGVGWITFARRDASVRELRNLSVAAPGTCEVQ